MDNQASSHSIPGKIDLPSLGHRLLELRSGRHWSLRHLSRLTRLRPERISRLEHGSVGPGLQEIATLAAIYGTGLDSLVHGIGFEGDLARVAARRGVTAEQARLALRALTLGLAVLQQEGKAP